MSNMFCRCESLTSIDVSHFDTSHTESFARMFRDCVKVETLNVSHFQTQRVLHMENMFYGCKCLKYLDLRGFDCSKAADLSYMFYGCQSLKNVLTANFLHPANNSIIIARCFLSDGRFAVKTFFNDWQP